MIRSPTLGQLSWTLGVGDDSSITIGIHKSEQTNCTDLWMS